MIHACFHTICYMFCLHLIAFLCIFGTNILTRCPSASSCFLLFFRFRKVLKEIFSELDGTKTQDLIISSRTRSPKGSRRRTRGRPHPRVARPTCLPRHQVVWPPRASTDAALSPIYSSRREYPKHPNTSPEKHPSPPPSSTLVREGSEALPGTLPERGIIAGGLYTTMPASGQMSE